MTRLIEIPFSKSFASKFRLEDEFSRSQKKNIELFLNPFSFDATVHYCDANCRKKVHGMVLVYHLISRQPPLCVFDDGFNLSVCHNLNIVV